MSDRVKHTLLRLAMILVTIAGAVYVFSVITQARGGDAEPGRIMLALVVVGALVWLNRWWFRRTGSRI
jgi:hypothetical protein